MKCSRKSLLFTFDFLILLQLLRLISVHAFSKLCFLFIPHCSFCGYFWLFPSFFVYTSDHSASYFLFSLFPLFPHFSCFCLFSVLFFLNDLFLKQNSCYIEIDMAFPREFVQQKKSFYVVSAVEQNIWMKRLQVIYCIVVVW